MLQVAGICSVPDLWKGARGAGATTPALCCPWASAFNFNRTLFVGRQKHARDVQVACVMQT